MIYIHETAWNIIPEIKRLELTIPMKYVSFESRKKGQKIKKQPDPTAKRKNSRNKERIN